MIAKLFTLTDNGCTLLDGTPVTRIDGLDGSRIKHTYWSGYPNAEAATVLFQAEVKPYLLILYNGTIPGGVEIASNKLVLTLVDKFGWPELGTSLDDSGLPVQITTVNGPTM